MVSSVCCKRFTEPKFFSRGQGLLSRGEGWVQRHKAAQNFFKILKAAPTIETGNERPSYVAETDFSERSVQPQCSGLASRNRFHAKNSTVQLRNMVVFWLHFAPSLIGPSRSRSGYVFTSSLWDQSVTLDTVTQTGILKTAEPCVCERRWRFRK